MKPRRFPSPWCAELAPKCFIVRDANDLYYESERLKKFKQTARPGSATLSCQCPLYPQ
jgi:hypothetical protein